MMASLLKAETEKVIPEGEPDSVRMTQQVQNLFKFKNFYNQMDFSPKGCVAISKAIIELIDP